MPVAFFEATISGVYQGQIIEDVFGYQALGTGVAAGPELAEFDAIATAIAATVGPELRAILPEAYTMNNLYLKRYGDDGVVDTIPGYFNVIDLPGEVNDPSDGQGLVAIFKKLIGFGEAVMIGGAKPNRGYWAIGPITSTSIQDNFSLEPSTIASAAFTALRAALFEEPATGLADVELRPAVLSHWLPSGVPGEPGERVEGVAGYAYLIGCTTRLKASFRRSRTQGP